jgi:hypothetical protein
MYNNGNIKVSLNYTLPISPCYSTCKVTPEVFSGWLLILLQLLISCGCILPKTAWTELCWILYPLITDHAQKRASVLLCDVTSCAEVCLPSHSLEMGFITPFFYCYLFVLLSSSCFCGLKVLAWSKYATIWNFEIISDKFKVNRFYTKVTCSLQNKLRPNNNSNSPVGLEVYAVRIWSIIHFAKQMVYVQLWFISTEYVTEMIFVPCFKSRVYF